MRRTREVKRLTHAELADAHGRAQWAVLWEQALPLVKFAVKRLITAGSLAAEYATDDLLQEGNLAAGQVIRTWDPFEGAFSTWVIRRVSGALADHIRRESNGMVGGEKAHGTTGSLNEGYRLQTIYGPPAGYDDPAEEADRLQVTDRVRAAVAVLPEDERAVVEAVYGLTGTPETTRQFAARTGKPKSTVGDLLLVGVRRVGQNTSNFR